MTSQFKGYKEYMEKVKARYIPYIIWVTVWFEI
jgi:hypothetical protein